MVRKSVFYKFVIALVGFTLLALSAVEAKAILGSKENPRLVPEGYTPAPTTPNLKEGETPSFISADGKEQINAEREAVDLGRLGQYYKIADGRIWFLGIYQKGIDENRQLFYHFRPQSDS